MEANLTATRTAADKPLLGPKDQPQSKFSVIKESVSRNFYAAFSQPNNVSSASTATKICEFLKRIGKSIINLIGAGVVKITPQRFVASATAEKSTELLDNAKQNLYNIFSGYRTPSPEANLKESKSA